MRIRVRYDERTTREAIVEADSLADVQAEWALRYGSGVVDEIEEHSVEIDGGILWGSVEIEEVE